MTAGGGETQYHTALLLFPTGMTGYPWPRFLFFDVLGEAMGSVL
jgi:membrane protein DedA with SNARE-associated domain